MNEKNIVIRKLNELNTLYYDRQNPARGSSEAVLEQMEFLLMSYLEKSPQDTDMWLRLCMLEYTPPWQDYERLEKYIMNILVYDENNVQALLVLAYAQYVLRGDANHDLFIRLQKCCDVTIDKESLSMLYLAIAWYHNSWPLKNKEKYELSLLKSIAYCSNHVKNYKSLGKLYLETGR